MKNKTYKVLGIIVILMFLSHIQVRASAAGVPVNCSVLLVFALLLYGVIAIILLFVILRLARLLPRIAFGYHNNRRH
jgi:hypothetical protein